MVMQTYLEDFVVYLEAERGYSPATASAYRYDLRDLLAFMTKQDIPLEPQNATTAVIRKWIVAMFSRNLSAATIARRIYALRSFWKYLLSCEYVSEDPVARISVPKQERKLPKHLGPEDLQKLLEASKVGHYMATGWRNYAMMCVLIYTGVRRAELINLRLGDLGLSEATITVRGKGGKTRVLPLVDEAVGAVQVWLRMRPETADHDYLFTTLHGNRIHEGRMQLIWKGILERSGIEKDGVSLHTLRHSLATLLLRSRQCSIAEIQRILGHSRLETTAIYLHVTDADLRDAVNQHPLVGRKPSAHDA